MIITYSILGYVFIGTAVYGLTVGATDMKISFWELLFAMLFWPIAVVWATFAQIGERYFKE